MSSASFDPAATQDCLDQADWTEGPPYDCVGQAADQCMSTGDGSTTVGMGYCLDAEWHSAPRAAVAHHNCVAKPQQPRPISSGMAKAGL